jgi:hypothetical protein
MFEKFNLANFNFVLGKFAPTTLQLCGVATVKIACDFG